MFLILGLGLGLGQKKVLLRIKSSTFSLFFCCSKKKMVEQVKLDKARLVEAELEYLTAIATK